mmetsp:Transcript_17882/g.41381  ORF Transcript_17882/g.41381 Transcript_17882/m.41381 type:complete len:112 (+) Transcript_17882:152-487(+)
MRCVSYNNNFGFVVGDTCTTFSRLVRANFGVLARQAGRYEHRPHTKQHIYLSIYISHEAHAQSGIIDYNNATRGGTTITATPAVTAVPTNIPYLAFCHCWNLLIALVRLRN